MNPFCYLRKLGRIILVGLTSVELIKCLVFPNTLDVLILVGLLMLLVSVLAGNEKSL